MKKISICLAVVGMLVGFASISKADVMRHDRGDVIIDNKGTVYFVGWETIYPFPSMKVFKSYGHELSDIQVANAADLALTVGAVPVLNNRPFGHVDEITAEGLVRGWAVDRDYLTDTDGFTLWAFFDEPYTETGDYKYTSVAAGIIGDPRLDVNSSLEITGNHGFEFSVIDEVKDGLEHTVYVYAVDEESVDKPVLLLGSPMRFIVSASSPASEGSKLSMISPNGGDYWILDSWETIYWSDEKGNVSDDTYRLYLVDTYSSEYHLIASGITGTYYDWIVGSLLGQTDLASPGLGYKIQVINERNGSYDESDDEFTIYEQASSSSLSSEEEQELTNVITVIYLLASLEDYYTTYGVFPNSLDTFVSSEEVNLSPAAIGVCSQSDGQIVYTPTNNSTNFTLKFCLGTDYLYNYFESEPELASYKSSFTKGVKVWDWQNYVQVKDL